MIDTIKTDNYTDITNSWLKNKQYGHNNCNVIDAKYYVYNNIKYNVDKKNVILDYSKQERRIALWLCNTFGSNVYMMPRINYPNGIMTADYLFKNEYWDLKTIKGSGKRSIEDAKKEKKKRRKRGLGKSLIMSIRANRVRTVNGRKRNCEHFAADPLLHGKNKKTKITT